MTGNPTSSIGPGSAVGRWVGLGPYYAMFPSNFAFSVVEEFCPTEGSVLDPFAGRASSIYAAAALNRSGCGIEINSVGWLYGRVKLGPADKCDVVARIQSISHKAEVGQQERLEDLPTFFHACYTPRVLSYLLDARRILRWRTDPVDATVMATILVHLHGKRSQSLSNQMRQGKAMSPAYCLRWWHENQSAPPDIDPVDFLLERINWRYAKGVPSLGNGSVLLGDSIAWLPRLAADIDRGDLEKFDLLFTSPPYYGVTNYNYDQWLRLWMLGAEPRPVHSRGVWQNKFESRAAYRKLLERVFAQSADVLDEAATIYVRTDARPFTYETTLEVLRQVFPGKRLTIERSPYREQTQTALFGDKSKKPGDIDLILMSQ